MQFCSIDGQGSIWKGREKFYQREPIEVRKGGVLTLNN